jgi:DNA-directed RNA polymerase subunit M/transcription elongation factor TFIIS
MASTDLQAGSDYIGFECHLCGTRMFGRPEQVGRVFKCPDCGARTAVPSPPRPKPQNIPAAMEGEQYELWDADELPSDIVALQPRYIAVDCRKCGTLMYATEDQVGQTIVCPDCRTKHTVPAPRQASPKRSPLTRDAETPQLDPATAPRERPSALSPEVQHRIEEEARRPQQHAYGDKLDRRGRPIPPRWPLVSGILSFPFYAGCRFRWATLSLGLVLCAALLMDGIPAWLYWQGDTSGALAAMGGLVETIIGAVGSLIWLAATSSIIIAVVAESSEGHNHISKWPTMNFVESMAEMLPVLVAFVVTAMPGWALGQLIAPSFTERALLTGGTLLLGFPIALLSQLAGGSSWELINLRVLWGMSRCPFSTLLFYVESSALAGVCMAATVVAAQVHSVLPLALAPMYVGCAMIYARLLGRYGWRLAESVQQPPA